MNRTLNTPRNDQFKKSPYSCTVISDKHVMRMRINHFKNVKLNDFKENTLRVVCFGRSKQKNFFSTCPFICLDIIQQWFFYLSCQHTAMDDPFHVNNNLQARVVRQLINIIQVGQPPFFPLRQLPLPILYLIIVQNLPKAQNESSLNVGLQYHLSKLTKV